jgi:hydroxymethylpyrimidine pyrophosphatase-like HAD family hydrolase
VCDVHPPCKGKAEGLRVLQELYGIAPERVVAVGDASNDVPMFEAAGLAVAMRESMEEALAAADRVIGSNDSETIGALVEELFLDGRV